MSWLLGVLSQQSEVSLYCCYKTEFPDAEDIKKNSCESFYLLGLFHETLQTNCFLFHTMFGKKGAGGQLHILIGSIIPN